MGSEPGHLQQNDTVLRAGQQPREHDSWVTAVLAVKSVDRWSAAGSKQQLLHLTNIQPKKKKDKLLNFFKAMSHFHPAANAAAAASSRKSRSERCPE